jgi:hypothetical protein
MTDPFSNDLDQGGWGPERERFEGGHLFGK